MQELARSLAHARGELKRLRADMTKFKAQERHRMKVVEDIVNNKQISIAQIEQIKSGDFEPLAKKSKVLQPETDVDRKLKERLQKKLKMRSKIDPETMQKSGFRGCPGALWQRSGWSWGVWGSFLRFLVRCGGDFWRSWGEDGPKMDARWAKLAASCAQDGP